MFSLSGASLRLFILCAFVLTAIPGSSTAAEGNSVDHPLLRIAGSDQMAALIRALSKEYGVTRPSFRHELDARGSGTAPPLLLRGQVQIAAMTRELNALEQRAFDARYGRQPVRIAIAIDAVAVLVSASNPVERLNLEQVDSIFSASRRCGGRGRAIHLWGEVGANDWAERRIGVVVTPRTSGTREYFAEHALCGGEFAQGARELPGANSVLRALEESNDSIGYASRAALTPAANASSKTSPRAKAVSLEGRFGKHYSPTTDEHLRSGKYPLTRSLYLYVVGDGDNKVSGPTTEFITFVLSDAGQQIVEQQGFLPLTADSAATQRAVLD